MHADAHGTVHEALPPPNELRLLLVDDNASFRSGLRRSLLCLEAPPRYISVEADSGDTAIEQLKTNAVDCVLLDFKMPGGDGLHWLGQILHTSPETAVIMITGNGDEETAVAALKAGASDYLVKGSVTPHALEKAVLNAVEKSRMRAKLQEQRAQLLQAERHRVMIQSLGAACHHLGQPATSINCCLELMQRLNPSPEMLELIQQCRTSADAIADLLDRLQHVSTYRTVPYCPVTNADGHTSDSEILDIEPIKA
jgi:DNA-binding NarL/FixJ family response regulator